ncbi:ThiF family adenylyltransferase [Candidatus Gracilibacteria bacterium]|nr:ThiF family adenylyltransferase [Candidatus Gracilibacteria bacterium]MCF7898426.1 ThiF family adenylyltransferase [Candidatus Paceibacterota bacterium]
MIQEIEEILKNKGDNFKSEPIIFDLSNTDDEKRLIELNIEGKVKFIIDDYEEQQLELFGINNPTKVYTPSFKDEFDSYYKNLGSKTPISRDGNWVYFPWSLKLIHILKEDDFQLVRTARNMNLISREEQEKFHNATIGIGGLSVGSSVAFALVLQGGPKHIKLADMDRLALTNTNRILMGVDDLGVLKVEMAARRIYEINPYSKVEIFPEGLQVDNIDKFFEGLDIIIDELDNIAIKYLIREKAKQYKIPVIMATDNGDNAVVDVERYDKEDNIKYFHGRMGDDISYESLLKLDKFGIGKMATKCVGPENVTIKMQESLLEMGKTIVSWPQLGGAALVNGAAVAYCVRRILNNQSVINNRALISIDEKLIPNYNEEGEVKKREDAADMFRKIFGL